MAYTDEFGNIYGDETDLELYGDTGIFSNPLDDFGNYIPWTGGDVFDWGGANESDFWDTITRLGKSGLDAIKSAFTKDGKTDWRAIATAGGALLPLLTGGSGSSSRPSGYQGGIPQYTALRETVQGTYDPNRRPGSGGQRYFSDVSYVPKSGTGPTGSLNLPASASSVEDLYQQVLNRPAGEEGQSYWGQKFGEEIGPTEIREFTTAAQPELLRTQAQGLAALNAANPAREDLRPIRTMARGGIVGLQDGGFVVPADVVSHLGNGSTDAGLAHLTRKGAVPIRGKGDGMSDSNRTTINGRQPAAVADGEAYLPPRQVQNMGGAEKLYAMMDKIRRDRTGSPKQGKQINPNQYV